MLKEMLQMNSGTGLSIIRFRLIYFNSIPPDQTDRVEFRLILDDIDDSGFILFIIF